MVYSTRRHEIPKECDFCRNEPIAFIQEFAWTENRRAWVCREHSKLLVKGLTLSQLGSV